MRGAGREKEREEERERERKRDRENPDGFTVWQITVVLWTSVFTVLGTEASSLHMLSKSSTTQLHPWLSLFWPWNSRTLWWDGEPWQHWQLLSSGPREREHRAATAPTGILKGRKWPMNLLQAPVRPTLIILYTLWNPWQPRWGELLCLCLAWKWMNQPFSVQLEEPIACVSLCVSLLCFRLNIHLRLNGCRITLHVKYNF